MLKRSFALNFMADVLFNSLKGDDRPTVDQCRGMVMDLQHGIATNKVQAIFELRYWVNQPITIVLHHGVNDELRRVLVDMGVLGYLDASVVQVKQNPHPMTLKEAKDLIDFFETVFQQTEVSSF